MASMSLERNSWTK